MEIKARVARLEQAIKRGRKRAGGDRCRCWDNCPVIVDRGDGLAEYPPEDGGTCQKCGKRFKGIPGVNSPVLVIVTGGTDDTHEAQEMGREAGQPSNGG